MDLTDEQWDVIKPLIPQPPKRPDGRGRPRRDNREILNGILWIMRTGAPWKDLPERYPPYQTCHRRFQEWVRSGTFEVILRMLVKDMKERGDLDLTECFIDGTFVIAKKGAKGWEKPSGAKVQRSWQWQTALVFLSPYPLAVLPERLIGDKAYDSDPLDAKLAENGVELIAPHRSNRKKARTQDGRKLRRYRRRWKIERLFAWLQIYRRILVRFDRLVENYIGFVHLGCLVILLRHYF